MTALISGFALGGGGGSPAMTASAYPATVNGAAATSSTVTILTSFTLATPSGGTAPYSYAWSLVTSSGGTWSIGHSTLSETQFVCAGVADGAGYTADFKCQVTDSDGHSAFTNTVTATVTNFGSFV